VDQIKRHSTVVCLAEALQFILEAKPLRGLLTLITFDDGYLDNYQLAYPVLRGAGVPATFFLITSRIGTSDPLWWDAIAYAIRSAKSPQVSLNYPREIRLPLDEGRRNGAIREAIAVYKSAPDPEQFLRHLQDACNVSQVNRRTRLFLNWEEAAEMANAGMDIGAHTHTHPVLSSLPIAGQATELETCRRLLEEKLARRIDTLAYPYGTQQAFNEDSFRALEQAGYRAAFSYYGGINRVGRMNPYNLMRVGVGNAYSTARLRLQVALAAKFAGYWF
jgi:peptidoglycan/xylan/chitin deacetylase (PgdA/CDA1 family)